MTVDKLIYEAIGASFEVYNALGPGLLENFDVGDFKIGYKIIK